MKKSFHCGIESLICRSKISESVNVSSRLTIFHAFLYMPAAGGISFTGFYLTLTVTQIKILLPQNYRGFFTLHIALRYIRGSNVMGTKIPDYFLCKSVEALGKNP